MLNLNAEKHLLSMHLVVQLFTLHYITLHYITLHYDTVFYFTLLYVTLPKPETLNVNTFFAAICWSNSLRSQTSTNLKSGAGTWFRL
jgi:hypothetical protein